ncbi:somatomedin-B and thrombospondin type-1 domain-containing protein-like isoform X1 [Manacus candei]|uniref:somatomedin-B and thrombospondin type-1 domain-containing protein-like isoform X1 n=1 Tax=Manacus candei TaxID=415023 RepID=UPI002227FB5D|nr:somatomedin-B and thrombospondin type-1 domain-containing protein-like isoform X1 [Manacus candei]
MCSQAAPGLCCPMHCALLVILGTCVKSLPCWDVEGQWSRREQALSPRPAPGAVRHARRSQPTTSTALAPHPASRRCRAVIPLGLQGPGAMQGLLLWGGWLLATSCLVGATGSCRHRCCPGRNNVCWAPSARRAHCYCDSYCQRTGDCCQDYHATCRRAAVGCSVGPWGPWSGCSSPCGVGSRARSRQVTVPPRHGGEPCPDLKQRRGCLGEHPTCGTAKGNVGCLMSFPVADPMCCRPRCLSRGVFNHPHAPHGCSSARGSQDTPQVLQLGLQRSLAKSWAATAGGALWVGPPCRGQGWSRRLHRDKQVCVECWGDVSHHRAHCTGHGLQGARTFWVAASVVGCQGSWVQEGLQEGCVCSPPALIFV